MFLTNKYLNLTARAVRAFDPDDRAARDYTPGTGALLMWGRPGFDDQNHDGEAPPYFMYHPLPFELSGDRIDFAAALSERRCPTAPRPSARARRMPRRCTPASSSR